MSRLRDSQVGRRVVVLQRLAETGRSLHLLGRPALVLLFQQVKQWRALWTHKHHYSPIQPHVVPLVFHTVAPGLPLVYPPPTGE